MSNIKKIIGVVLALVMAFSAATVAFAVSNDDAAFTVAVTADKDQLAAGESATVTVKLTTNFYASTFSIPVFYDNAKLEVSDATTSITDATVASNSSAYPDDLYAGTGLTSADKGVVAVIYVAQVGDDIAMYNNTTVMTFTVTAKDDAEGSDVIGCLEASLKKSFAEGQSVGALYAGKDEDNDDDIMDDTAIPVANATLTSATVTFASAMEPADLAVKSAYATSGIVIDNHKTFGGQYDGVVYGFTLEGTINAAFYTDRLEATNGGSITIVKTPYVARPVSYGTGATVQVYNSDSTLSKTYVIVLIGDVNGDAKILATDSTAVYNHVNNISVITDPVKIMAANAAPAAGRTDALKATSMYTINATDTTAIYAAVNGTDINQATLASQHATYNTYYQ